jgi:hypothetical protein
MNEEIRNYNRKLNKVIKGFKNVQLINVLSEWILFTKHGMHMNAKGKELMVGKLVEEMSTVIDNHNVM